MKILWLIPLSLPRSNSSVTQGDFMVYEKNEIARSIRELDHEIEALFSYIDFKFPMDGFSKSSYFQIKRPKLFYTLLYHLKMLISVVTTNSDVILFNSHSFHLIPLSRVLCLFKKAKTNCRKIQRSF